jgi:hypothetical protein
MESCYTEVSLAITCAHPANSCLRLCIPAWPAKAMTNWYQLSVKHRYHRTMAHLRKAGGAVLLLQRAVCNRGQLMGSATICSCNWMWTLRS